MAVEVLPEQSNGEEGVEEIIGPFGFRIRIGHVVDLGQQTRIMCSRGSDGPGKGVLGSWLGGPDYTPGEGILTTHFKERVKPVLGLIIEERIKPLFGL